MPKRLREPVPFVVEEISTFKRYNIKNVLDLGCGAGRHCIYLAKEGVNVVGVDVSKNALRLANKWIRKEKLTNIELIRAMMTALPFRNSHFDAVISVSVIHHALKRDITKTIDEIHRILKENGLLLANLASIKDYRYGKWEEVEKGTFLLPEEFKDANFKELHNFFSKREVSQLLAKFSKTNIQSLKGGRKNKPHHFWKIIAFK